MPAKFVCSFCRRNEAEAGVMMEFPDRLIRNRRINICRDCAALAIEVIDRETQRRGGEPPAKDTQ